MLELGEKLKIGTDGFIQLVESWGSDERVVQAARLTSGSDGDAAGDRTLLRYLMRHRHGTPFEFAGLTVHVRIPMDSWRQWIRHRTAAVNEYSTRYSEAIDSMAKTEPNHWRCQSGSNRQGSSELCLPLEQGEQLTFGEAKIQALMREEYLKRIGLGVANELARKDLPLSTYTEAWWTCNLRNVLHFLSLRMEKHAQAEIREFATNFGERIVRPLFPMAYQAFLDYDLNAITLSAHDVAVINMWKDVVIGGLGTGAHAAFGQHVKLLDLGWTKREQQECVAKLMALGLLPEE